MLLKEKVALITGAANGIGKATALAMAKEGAKLVIIDINREGIEKVGEEINQLGGECLVMKGDVTNKEQTDKVFETITTTIGQLDILVNNVGGAIVKPAVDVTEEEWDFLFDTNLKSMFYYSQQAGKIMLKQKSGVVINLSSILGLGGIPRRIGYSAAKSAVNSLTQTLACEWALDGVRVNAVAPGYILTDALQNHFDEGTLKSDNMYRRTPQGRLGTPEDIAQAILFLASDNASFITGTTLYVDGGYAAYHAPEPVPSRW